VTNVAPLRIAFVSQPGTTVVPPIRSADSISIWTYEVARRLASSAHPVIYSKRLRDQPSVERDAGIEYRRVIAPGGKRLQHLARRMRLPATDWLERQAHFVYALAVALDVRRCGADVIHVHNFSQLVPVLRALNPKSRIVLHMHCEWLSQIDAGSARRRIADVDRVLGCSEYIVRLVQRRFPEFADRMGVLYNGADVAAFSEDSPRPEGQTALSSRHAAIPQGQDLTHRGAQVLFVGRITPEKGLHDLLDAFERVLDRLPNAGLTILGPAWRTPRQYIVDLSDDPQVQALGRFYVDDDYLALLKRRMSPRLRAAVDFPGEVARQDLPEYYRKADVLVNPSLSESFGMSLIEAHASSRPVVATRVGGMQELVRHGENGLLVAPASPTELSEALLTLLESAELRQRFGQEGRADAARRFAWERIAEDALRHYCEILERA
jgi:spore coat protein SA